MVAVMKDAEPFSFEGGDIGVLVLHGFTGSTPEHAVSRRGTASALRLLCRRAAPAGTRNVPGRHGDDRLPRLDGRGGTGASGTREAKEQVFVTGLSMGGTLTVNLAARLCQTNDRSSAHGAARPDPSGH
jgi:carboxylesterase